MGVLHLLKYKLKNFRVITLRFLNKRVFVEREAGGRGFSMDSIHSAAPPLVGMRSPRTENALIQTEDIS